MRLSITWLKYCKVGYSFSFPLQMTSESVKIKKVKSYSYIIFDILVSGSINV